MVFLFLVIAILWGSPAVAQEKSLVDILQAKGVLSKKEAQQLKKRTAAKTGGSDQQALINLLRKKGVLEEDDLAQLQAPPAAVAVAPAPPSPEVTQWLTHLEAKQQQLEAQTELQAKAAEDFRRTAVVDTKKTMDWLNRISLFGDIRLRHEGFFQDGVDARNRERFRLRVGARIQISDELEGGIRLVSGDPNEIISNNQTMTDVFTRKPINIDNVYITIRPAKSIGLEKAFFSVTGGKFVVNFFRPRATMLSELVFDEDLTPEGAAEEITVLEGQGVFRNLKLLGGQWALKEISNGPDSYMVGEQAVLNLAPTPISQLALAAGAFGDPASATRRIIRFHLEVRQ